MDISQLNKKELTALVTRLVIEQVNKIEAAQNTSDKVLIGVSNRHVHLDRETMDVLFGKGSELHFKKELVQPGQFASEETVTIKGPRGEIKRVRVLGPLRAKTQIEVSKTDSFTLGIKPPVRESGHLDGTPGLTLIGPKGSVDLDAGCIIALRHIHMSPDDASHFGVTNGQVVRVKVGGDRGGILDDVVVRVSPKYKLEMHVDVDEGNGLGLATGDFVEILKPECKG